MIVYVDVLFAINMLMDMTILWSAGMLLKQKIKLLNIIFGSAAGALMYIATLYRPYINTALQILVIIMSVSLSVIISYCPKNLLMLLKLLIASLSVSFVLAGITFMLMCLKATGIRQSLSGIAGSFSYMLLLLSASVIYISVKLGGKYIRGCLNNKKKYYDITVYLNGNLAEIRALSDTGNSLKDNIGNNEIIISEYAAVKELFPDSIAFINDGVDMFRKLSSTALKTRIRLIPFKSIGNPNGIILGIRIDKAEIKTGVHRTILKENIILGICTEPLDSAGQFNAIINNETIL